MIARPSTPFRSGNAGEMSRDARGRVDVKQYYSAFLACKNIEPVPQGGFRQMGGSWRVGLWRKPLADRAITSPSAFAGPHSGTQTVWQGSVAGAVAAVFVDALAINAGGAAFSVEAQIGGVWSLIGGPFAVTAAGGAQSRMAAFAPGGQQTATALRVRATFSEAASVTIGGVTAFFEAGTAIAPRMTSVTLDNGQVAMAMISPGIGDIWTDAGFQGAVRLPMVTADMLLDLNFYAEARTIGLFHEALRSQRLFLATPTELDDWRGSDWPYDPLPDADLDGIYAKTDDIWEVWLRWTFANSTYLYLALTVDGEQTSPPTIPLTNAGTPVTIGSASAINWADFAAAVQTALRAMPTMGAGVTVTEANPSGPSRKLTITFGGALTGQEYQVSALVSNTADASALPFHTQIGETDFEALLSAERGWPGVAALVQDRMGYARIPALPGANLLSRVAEYFDLGITSVADNAARMDVLRSKTSEKIVHVAWSNYLIVLTDRAAYFVPNRTIERNTPLNFVKVSELGAQPTAVPFEVEGELHYVGINPQGMPGRAQGGEQVLKAVYDDVATKYSVAPISLIASHLTTRVLRSVTQSARSDTDAARAWLMRSDGRLIAGQFIASQEITGFTEWVPAHQGMVRDIRIDGRNRLWLAVERGDVRTFEIYDADLWLQDALTTTTDLSGAISGLPWADGVEVWAVADGYVLGPFPVIGGAIALEDPYSTVIVGRWRPPYAETMPQVHVNGNDEVIWRPGRIHGIAANLIDTTSIAIGANGEPPRDVDLVRTTDPVDQPLPAKTELIRVDGDVLTGVMTGTTAVFTQTRPGAMRVRDFYLETKL